MIKHCKYLNDITAEFELREGSTDELMQIEIWDENQYFPQGFELSKGSVVLDIGACIGVFAILASKLGAATIYAYEPFPPSYDAGVANVCRNNCNNITFINSAVVGQQRRVLMYPPKIRDVDCAYAASLPFNERFWQYTHYGDLRILNDTQVHSEEGGIVVPTVTIHDVLSTHKNIDYIKLDCEGSEYEIINEMLDEEFSKIKMIACEYHDGWDLGKGLLRRFEKCGFDTYVPFKGSHGLIYARR